MGNCPNCGATVNDKARFCPNCAYSLLEAVQTKSSGVVAAVQARHCQNCGESVSVTEKFCANCAAPLDSGVPVGRSIRKPNIIIGLVVVVGAAIAVCIALLSSSSKSGSDSIPSQGVPSDTYYPLKEGLKWEYKVSSTNGQATTMVKTNLAARELKGETVIPQKDDYQTGQVQINFFMRNTDGVYVYALQGANSTEPEINKSPDYLIKYPIQVGTRWDCQAALDSRVPLKASIQSIDETVTVPAGTFNGCVRVKKSGATQKGPQINIEESYWFAPKVGLIKFIIDIRGGIPMSVAGQLQSFK